MSTRIYLANNNICQHPQLTGARCHWFCFSHGFSDYATQ